MNDFQDSKNPYREETGQYASPEHATPPPPASAMPGFAKGILIAGIVFACLRALTVPLSILGWVAMADAPEPDPMLPTVPFEVITSVGITLFGLATCILLLMRKPLGITMSYILAVFVLGSLAVAVWQGFGIAGKFPPGSPEASGAVIGVVMVGMIRIGWLIAFYIGVHQCGKWLAAGNAR